jgi:WD40 repeat protein
MTPLMEQKTGILLATSCVNAVAFSPDGKLLASAYSNGTVWLWNPVSGQAEGLAPSASSPASADSVAFSPDGKLLAGAESSGTLRLWNPPAGQHGDLASGGRLITAASVIAVAISALTVAITTRAIRPSNRRLPSLGRRLWRSCY